jgi:DNA-binding transcriptional ArsR family regulator
MEEEIQETLTLSTQAQWKAVSHPLRLAILKTLIEREQTNEELARALRKPSGQLHYHTRTLLDAGLIRQVATRDRGHLTEKLYRAVARSWRAAPPTLGGESPPLLEAIQAGLDLYRASWDEAGDALSPQMGFHLVLPRSVEKQNELIDKIRALFAEFQTPTTPDGSESTLALTVLLHSTPEKDTKDLK